MRVRHVTAVKLGILLLVVAGITPTAWADHADGNISQSVNYFAVNGGAVRVCDSSQYTSGPDLDGAMAAWNANVGKTVLVAGCTDPSINVMDVADGTCGGSSSVLGCGDFPDQESRQVRRVRIESDIDPIAEAPFLGSYFPNSTLSGSPTMQRTDQVVDFNWGTGSPGGSLPTDGFSVRWTTTWSFSHGGDFTFTTTTDDGVRLWVDGQLLINDWYDHPVATQSATVHIAPGTRTIQMEYYDACCDAIARLQVADVSYLRTLLAHELGHTLGFKHTRDGCGTSVYPPTIMGKVICENDLAISTTTETSNWDLAYWADAALSGSLPGDPGDGCISYNWLPGEVHNEKRFETWHFDGFPPSLVRTDPQDAYGMPTTCGQMPGTRTYRTYSVTDGHVSYYGGNFAYNITVSGTLPQMTSVVPYGSETMVVYWDQSVPAGADVHLEVSTSSANGPWVSAGTDTVSPFTHLNRSAATRYWYRLRSHSHTGGGYSAYSNVLDNYTPPNLPTTAGGTFNVDNNPNKVSTCFTSMQGATSYSVFYYKAGSSTSVSYTVSPNTSCYGSVLHTVTRSDEVYHIAVKACVGGTICSPYRDLSGAYWWWIPCSTSTGCSAGGTADSSGHNH